MRIKRGMRRVAVAAVDRKSTFRRQNYKKSYKKPNPQRAKYIFVKKMLCGCRVVWLWGFTVIGFYGCVVMRL